MDDSEVTLEDCNITRNERDDDSSVQLDASVNVEGCVDTEKTSDVLTVDDVNNISRSYIISENGSRFVEDDVGETGDVSKCDISKSYVVSENNETTVVEETENPFLSNLEKSHEIESVVTNGKAEELDETASFDHGSYRKQSTNMALDSLDIHNMTQSYDDVQDVVNEGNQVIMEGNQVINEGNHVIIETKEPINNETDKDDPPSLGSCMEGNESIDKDVDEDDPPSLRSIKSIAERKKKKLIENQSEKSVKPDAKTCNRYGKSNNINTESRKKYNVPVSKGNAKKEEKLFSTKSQVKNITTKKPSSINFVKSSPKRINTDFHSPPKQLGHEDEPQKEIQQLHILNEKERKNSLKIYQNLKSSQSKWKTEKEKICSDYEKKIQGLNKKIILLSRKGNLQGESGILVPAMSEEDIKNLQNQIKQQESMITGFQLENERLYNSAKDQEILLKKTESQNEVEKRELLENIDALKMTHQLENEKLEKKLRWYVENQLLFERDANELKDSREKIKDLRILVEQLEAETRQLRNDNMELKRGLYSNSSKISTVKEQQIVEEPVKLVKESVLTSCVNSDSDVKSVEPSARPVHEKKIENSTNKDKEDRTVSAYLEKRVKILESELEEKDSENARRVRAIEQKYSILTSEYEDQTKQLEKRISQLVIKNASEKSYAEMEGDMNKIVAKHTIEIGEYKNIIDAKNGEISALKIELNNIAKMDSEGGFKPISVLQKQVETLKKKLKQKESHINELNTSIILLQKDRKFLTEEVQSTLNAKQLEQSPSRTYRKGSLRDSVELKRREQNNMEEKYLSALADNDVLKRLVEELQIEREESRLRYEAIEVKSQNEVRNLTEKFEEEKKEGEEKYRKALEDLKVGFAVEHSTSKMAELNGKVAGYELMIKHLKSTLEEAKIDRNKLNEMKVNKGLLEQKISQLQREVIEAQNFDTPEIRDYKKLVAKINVMEKNHYSREEKLQTIIENTKSKAVIDIKEVEDKWRQELHKKNSEVERFQEELDSIIEVLQDLQRQGVVITKYDHLNLPS